MLFIKMITNSMTLAAFKNSMGEIISSRVPWMWGKKNEEKTGEQEGWKV